ncbi:MFS transporter [Georgenia yuyongxinii]|uniref:MFS transporter n=1 Tax=Georgenia yuyongxinii TaxID=2589797 RepID=A0A5B8C6M0_9MICO|nr:glycoside-pentoside-hexuronide (GPH):cation symporter [Georgenia yuyongxinii]QDC24975.1 MFS transporter [Georgenia yuyongxinii]
MQVTTSTTTRASTGGKLTLRNYLGYAAGDAANGLSWSMAGMFLTLYYTNVVGIEGAVIGTMLLVVRFVDAFTDLLAGRAIDAKKPGRLGKFRPFILWFSLPLMLTNMAIYSAKWFFPEISGTAAVVYMYVTYLLMASVFMTLVNIAYGAMAPSLTQDPAERSKLSAFRMYGAAIAVLVLAFVISPQIKAYLEDPAALQRSLFITTGAFVLVGMALYLFLVFNTKEKVLRPMDTVTLRDSLRTFTTNGPLRWLSLGSVLYLAGTTAFSTLGSYIAIYVQQDAGYIAWNILAQTAGLFAVGPFIPLIVRTIGKRTGYLILGGTTLVAAALLAFGPLSTVPALGLVAFFVAGIGIYGVNTLMWALEADTVEYGEWRTGLRTEGTTYAGFSFTRKMGQAFGGFVGGLALTWAGFSAQQASTGGQQAAGVGVSIQLWAGLILGAFSILSVAVMFFYPLTEAKFREITAEIAVRRAAAEQS